MKKFFLIIFLIGVLAMPFAFVSAGLVPCGTATTPDCTLCDLIALFQNLINLFIKFVLFVVALALLIWAGFLIITDAGSGKGKKAGYEMIKKVITGVLIVLLSWTIINTLVFILAPTMTGPSGQPLSSSWYKIECHQTIKKP